MDIRQSPNYSKYMQSLGWSVEKSGKANVFIRHLPLLSRYSLIKIQRPENLDFKKLDALAKKHHALFVKLEPDVNTKYQILNTKFQIDNWPLLPSKTLVLDLNEIKLETLPKDTRYEIRKSQNNHLTIEPSNNVEQFYDLLKETMKIGKWNIPIHNEVISLWKSFQPKNSTLLLASSPPNSLPIAACLLIWHQNTAHYMYAALNKKGRDLGAAYFLLWNTIEFLRKKKIKYLDLEGIYDDRYPKMTSEWKGFTKFKLGWGGKVVEYPGAYTKYYNPLAKLLFSIGDLI